jgi:DNA-binding GntR family transcriptional regulator
MTDQPTRAAEGYESLHNAIVSGQLESGRPLIEAELAQKLQMSRTPVREALLRLELEGYATRDERNRLMVRLLSREEVTDCFAVRETLEAYVVSLAAERISDDEIRVLDSLISADVRALRSHSALQLNASNTSIHGLIAEASRNRAVPILLSKLRGRAPGLSAYTVGNPQDAALFVEDHREIVELISAGDGSGAAQVARRHFRRARDVLLRGFESPADPLRVDHLTQSPDAQGFEWAGLNQRAWTTYSPLPRRALHK